MAHRIRSKIISKKQKQLDMAVNRTQRTISCVQQNQQPMQEQKQSSSTLLMRKSSLETGDNQQCQARNGGELCINNPCPNLCHLNRSITTTLQPPNPIISQPGTTMSVAKKPQKRAWACNHSNKPHYGKGLCANCYHLAYYHRRRAALAAAAGLDTTSINE